MSTINYGNQEIWIQYKTEATSSYMNKQLADVLAPGILEGGNVFEKQSALNTVQILPFKAEVKTTDGHLIKFITSSLVEVDIDSVHPYIVASYTWLPVINNYLDFAKKQLSELTATDLIFAKALYGASPAWNRGTVLMGNAGNHNTWAVTPESFTVNVNSGGNKIIILSTNCFTPTDVINCINAALIGAGVTDAIAYIDDYAYGYVGLKTTGTGGTQTLVIAAGGAALSTLGWLAGTYTGQATGIIGFDFSVQSWTWRWNYAVDIFQIKKNLYVGGNAVFDGNVDIHGDVIHNLDVEDKTIHINKNGSTAASTAAGLYILGDSNVIVGYVKIDDVDNSLFTLKAPGNASIMTLAITATKTLTLAGALNIEADSAINQDLTSDANVVFNGVRVVDNAGFKLTDLSGNFNLTIKDTETLTGHKTLNIVMNNADRTLTFNADMTFDQGLSTTSSPTFVDVTAGMFQVKDITTPAYKMLLKSNSATDVFNADRSLTFDLHNVDRSIEMKGNLIVNATSTLNQDLSTTADVVFNSVTVNGDLTVNGTTTYIKTTNLEIKDKNIQINKSGTTAGAVGAGISILGDADAIVGYIQVGSADNSVFEFKTPGNLGILTLDINSSKTWTAAGSLNVEADSNINQDLTTDANPTFASLILDLLYLKDVTTAAYKMIVQSNSDTDIFTADRTLTIDLHNVNRTLDLQANVALNQNMLTTSDVGFNSVNIATGQGYKVNTVKVVGGQGGAITDAVTSHATASFGDVNNALDALGTVINNILSAMRTHGLIAT